MGLSFDGTDLTDGYPWKNAAPDGGLDVLRLVIPDYLSLSKIDFSPKVISSIPAVPSFPPRAFFAC